MSGTARIEAGDSAIDHRLAAVSADMPFLVDVTPVGLLETRRQFFADGRPPTFRYGPASTDPQEMTERLASIDTANVQEPALQELLRAKHRELRLQVEMLRCRATSAFLALSVELYGSVGPTLVADAEALLVQVAPPPKERGSRITAETLARHAEHELEWYRAAHPGMTSRVEIDHKSSGVMVVNGDVLIAPTATVPHTRLYSLLHHEIGTHVVTHVNGWHQPLQLLGAGLAGYDETQEGLAVFAEYLVGGLTARRLRQLAARVIAVHQMTHGALFTDVHRHLVDSGIRRVEAFTITMRAYRSGGLTKDAVYLRGLRHVIAHVANGGSLDVFWLGKMAIADVPHIEDLHQRGLLDEPLLTPRYMDEPGTRERLAAVTATTTPLDLIGTSG